MNHADIIEAKGADAVAEKLNVPTGHVRVWKSRKVIPRSRYAFLIDAFPDITLDMLKAGEPA